MKLRSIDDFDLKGLRVLLREDLNVPISNGVIRNDERIQAALPTLKHCLQRGASVIVLSHLGRPKEGEFNAELSLKPVAKFLTSALNQPVELISNWRDDVNVAPGRIALIENVRFEHGEASNDERLAREFAKLGDIFVMDAFATAHRAHASTTGVCEFVKQACAGPLLLSEIKALDRACANPEKPFVAVVGGAKVSDKLHVLENLARLADAIILGGGMANTFLATANTVGNSLYEPDLVEKARNIMEMCAVPLPNDVVVANEVSASARARLRQVDEIQPDEAILDIGPVSARRFASIIKSAGTVVWNGPMGVFEHDQFGEGTRIVGSAIAESTAFTLAGGGDTLAAIARNDLHEGIDYISTAGGAFLEYLEGRELPAIRALLRKAEVAHHP